MARKLPFRALLRRYGRTISFAAAYRIAVAERVAGVRRNHTQYAHFWQKVNWELPDSVLERVWGVTRGNLRQRRLRMGMGRPAFLLPADTTNARYRLALARERRRARSYHGPRP